MINASVSFLNDYPPCSLDFVLLILVLHHSHLTFDLLISFTTAAACSLLLLILPLLMHHQQFPAGAGIQSFNSTTSISCCICLSGCG